MHRHTPGMEAERVDIKALQRREEEEIKLADIACRQVYIRRVAKALKHLRYRREHERDAELIVSGKKSIDDILQGKGGEWEGVIRNACTEYQALADLCFLMVCAPKAGDQLPINHDQEARQIQLDHFYELLTRHKDKSKYPKDVQVVTTYDCLKQRINNFMETYASKSKRAMIVFNGHGKDSGHLSFENEGIDVTNSEFLQHIYCSWNQFKENHKHFEESMVLPTRVTAVLAHCFGYKHQLDEQYRSVIEVACLTNEHNPETRYVYKFNTVKTKIRESVHLDLINFARSEIQKEGSSFSTPTGSTAHGLGTSDDDGTNNSSQVSNRVPGTEREPAQAIGEIGMTSVACLAFAGPMNDGADQWLEELTSIRLTVTQKRLSRGMSSSEAGVSSALHLITAPLGTTVEKLPSMDISTLKAEERPESDEKRSQTMGAIVGATGLSTAVGGPSCSDDQTHSAPCSQIDGSDVRSKNLSHLADLSISQPGAEKTHNKSKKKTCLFKGLATKKSKSGSKGKPLSCVTQLASLNKLLIDSEETEADKKNQAGSITEEPDQDSP